MTSALGASRPAKAKRRLSLKLLGGFQVLVDDAPAETFESDLVRALLAYLAVERSRPHRRDALATLFWPEQPDDVASHRLRQALSNLRRVLGDGEGPTTLLLTTRTDLQINPAADVALDTSEFDALLAATRAHGHRRLATCSVCRRTLERATTLYQGPFLAGFSLTGSAELQQWASLLTEKFHQQALAALLALAEVATRNGAAEEAYHHARRVVIWEPWNEAAQRQVMRALALQGQRTAALRQFQQCRRALDQELGATPDRETIALYKRIRSGAVLDADSPPGRHNLPRVLSSFIGRQSEAAALEDLLATERLVTLTGVGGCGKTRLALHVAAKVLHAFADGVFVVELAALTDPRLLPAAVAGALGLREQAQRPLDETLRSYLQSRETLLVLDNCEHLADACANLAAALVRSCPRLTVMATSRQPLRVNGEVQWSVPPMVTPESVGDIPGEGNLPTRLLRYDAISLFVERARAIEPSFRLTEENGRAVAGICRRLDGLPLAIELASSHIRPLPPRAMLERMGAVLPLLTGGSRDLPARQKTLRDTIDWSYRLLTPDEQAFFRRLAVFRGGTLEAIQTVACDAIAQPGASSIALPALGIEPLEGVVSLVEKNLLALETTPSGQPRYAMLETVREFALERLAESGEADVVHRRHVLYFLKLAEEAEPEVRGPNEGSWLAKLELENPNLRLALDCCLERGYAEPGFRLALALWWSWLVRGQLTEGRQRLDALLARFPLRSMTGRRPADQAKALRAAAALASNLGDTGAARSYQEEGLAISRAIGDSTGVASALEGLVAIASRQGDGAAASAYVQEFLTCARAIGDHELLLAALLASANVFHEQGDLGRAREVAEEGVALLRQDTNPTLAAACQMVLSVVLQDLGESARAWRLTEIAITTCDRFGMRRTGALAITNLGTFGLARGDLNLARARFAQSLAIQQEQADTAGIAFVLERFAGLAVAERQPVRAFTLAGAAAKLRETVGFPLPAGSQAKLTETLAPARQMLDGPAAAEAWADGHRLAIDDAIRYALTAPEIISAPVTLAITAREAATPGRRGQSTSGRPNARPDSAEV